MTTVLILSKLQTSLGVKPEGSTKTKTRHWGSTEQINETVECWMALHALYPTRHIPVLHGRFRAQSRACNASVSLSETN